MKIRKVADPTFNPDDPLWKVAYVRYFMGVIIGNKKYVRKNLVPVREICEHCITLLEQQLAEMEVEDDTKH